MIHVKMSSPKTVVLRRELDQAMLAETLHEVDSASDNPYLSPCDGDKVPSLPCDALHHTQRQPLGLQDRPLLHVDFNIPAPTHLCRSIHHLSELKKFISRPPNLCNPNDVMAGYQSAVSCVLALSVLANKACQTLVTSIDVTNI